MNKCNDTILLTKAIKSAIEAGYRHFDCAYYYGNQTIIGKALNEAINESNGSLQRKDLFIVSKLWNTFHSKNRVPIALDDTLKQLNLDYIDLVIELNYSKISFFFHK